MLEGIGDTLAGEPFAQVLGKGHTDLTGKNAKRRVETLVSAGGVVYRRVEGSLQAVLCGRAMLSRPGAEGVQKDRAANGAGSEKFRWSLAKGTPDPGETMEETALREVREETGLEVEIDSQLGTIENWFGGRDPGVRFHKTVHFYLMVPVGGDTGLHDPEFDVVRWFGWDDALNSLAYINEADVLSRAYAVISQRISERQPE